jgi:acyl carrier protein
MSHETKMLDRPTVVRQLTAWVAELLPGGDQSAIDEDSSLTQAGFDSIATVQLLARAEDEFGVDLASEDETIQSADSVGALADSVIRLGSARS